MKNFKVYLFALLNLLFLIYLPYLFFLVWGIILLFLASIIPIISELSKYATNPLLKEISKIKDKKIVFFAFLILGLIMIIGSQIVKNRFNITYGIILIILTTIFMWIITRTSKSTYLDEKSIKLIASDYSLIAVIIPTIFLFRNEIKANVYFISIGVYIFIYLLMSIFSINKINSKFARYLLIQTIVTILINTAFAINCNTNYKDITSIIAFIGFIIAFIVFIVSDYYMLKDNKNKYISSYNLLCLSNLTGIILGFLELNINIKKEFVLIIALVFTIIAIGYYIMLSIKLKNTKSISKNKLAIFISLILIVLQSFNYMNIMSLITLVIVTILMIYSFVVYIKDLSIDNLTSLLNIILVFSILPYKNCAYISIIAILISFVLIAILKKDISNSNIMA